MAEFDITRIPRYSSKSSYAHFDHRVSFAEAQTKILDSEYVSHHAFYPLISNEIITVRYRGGKRSCKVRNIAYASHFDHRVFQYYSYLWSDLYNKKAIAEEFNEVAVAYRSSLSSDSAVTAASNISSAKKAFDYIREQDSAFVLTGDFESFFDNLNHAHIMTSLRSLFPGGRLPDDHYQVIKNILHYSCWPIADLAVRHELPWPVIDLTSEKKISEAAIELRRKSIREINKLDDILPKADFLANKSKVITRPWQRTGIGLGIPQGLAASGVLANIYMADIDMKVRLAVERVGGLYLRYCDDFIVAVPKSGFDALVEAINLMAMSIPLNCNLRKPRCSGLMATELLSLILKAFVWVRSIRTPVHIRRRKSVSWGLTLTGTLLDFGSLRLEGTTGVSVRQPVRLRVLIRGREGTHQKSASPLCINIIHRSVLREEGYAHRLTLTLLHFSATGTFFPTQREPKRRFQMIRLPLMRLRFTGR